MTTDTLAPDMDIANAVPERLQLDRLYDVEKLQKEVNEIVSSLMQPTYIYYSPVPLAFSVKDPTTHDWSSVDMLKGCDYIKEVLSGFEAELTSCRLMRLQEGAVIKEHCDPTLDAVHKEVVRLTLPIFSDDDVTFLLNGSEVVMQPGELWYMKLSEPHSVHNNSHKERINMSIDLVWNDWLENWFANNMVKASV